MKKDAPHQQHVETTSTSDSIVEIQFSEAMNCLEQSEATWCVTMPSEAVLHFDCLTNFCAQFGKVVALHDVNE